jgi:diguanylate cyclase (GGDEF)-like protein
VDTVTIAAGLGALAGVGVGWFARRRCQLASAEAAYLRRQLRLAEHAANHDPLTGLPNRRAFYRYGTALVADPTRHPLAVAVIDLDGFKSVNDRYGHATGDEVLVTLAARLATWAGGDLVARLSGDEFAGLLCLRAGGRACPSGLDGSGDLDGLARMLATSLGEPMRVGCGVVQVTASVGLVPVTVADNLTDALARADAAMYRVKAMHRKPVIRLRTQHTHHVETPPWAEAGG